MSESYSISTRVPSNVTEIHSLRDEVNKIEILSEEQKQLKEEINKQLKGILDLHHYMNIHYSESDDNTKMNLDSQFRREIKKYHELAVKLLKTTEDTN